MRFPIYPTYKLKRTVRCIILMWRWSGLVYEGPRKQCCGSAPKRCVSVPVSLFSLWRGSGSTFHFDADPDPVPYQSKTNLQSLEGFRPSTAPFLSLQASIMTLSIHDPPWLHFLSLHSSWFGSGSNLSLFIMIRIRIQHPKMTRIHADLDTEVRNTGGKFGSL